MMQEELQGKLWGHTRTALIASLLIYCIESLLGNVHSASIHAARSIGLLYTWRHQHAVSGKSLCAQDAFEQDLYPAFPGLDIQALLHLDDRPRNVHLGFQIYLDYSSHCFTSKLTSLNDGAEACQLLLRRNLHFIAAWRITDEYPHIASSLDHLVGNGQVWWSIALGPLKIPPSKRMEQKSCLEDIATYTASLNELQQQHSSESESSMAFSVYSTCRIHTAMNKILMTAACLPLRASWDSLMPDFLEIVNLCENLYPQVSSAGGTTYGFDVGLIVPLAVVAIRCRELWLRKKAIVLLLSRPGYREGIWDAEAMGHVCEWILEIEDEEEGNLSYMPAGIEGEGRLVRDEPAGEWKKATLLMVHFELDERRAKPFCALPMGRDGGEWILKDKIISW